MNDENLPLDVWLKKHAKSFSDLEVDVNETHEKALKGTRNGTENGKALWQILDRKLHEKKWVSVPELCSWELAKEHSLRKGGFEK